MSKVCSHCGTEVEDEALFCPACGQPFAAESAQELPSAPDWPEAARPGPAGTAPMPAQAPPPWTERRDPEAPPEEARGAISEEPPAPQPSAPAPASAGATEVPPWRRGVAARAATQPAGEMPSPAPAPSAGSGRSAQPSGAVVSTPSTLAGWLIGAGSLVGALALFLPWLQGVGYTELWGLASVPNILLLILLLGIAASIFLAELIPAFAQRQLAILAVTLIGVGIGLDAVARPASATGALLFLLALLVAAAGALLPDLGLDRRVGGPRA